MMTTIIHCRFSHRRRPFRVLIFQLIKRNNSQTELKRANNRQADIKKAHQESDRIKKDKMLQAKERFIELKAEHEKVIVQRKKIRSLRNGDKESTINKELQEQKTTMTV